MSDANKERTKERVKELEERSQCLRESIIELIEALGALSTEISALKILSGAKDA